MLVWNVGGQVVSVLGSSADSYLVVQSDGSTFTGAGSVTSPNTGVLSVGLTSADVAKLGFVMIVFMAAGSPIAQYTGTVVYSLPGAPTRVVE